LSDRLAFHAVHDEYSSRTVGRCRGELRPRREGPAAAPGQSRSFESGDERVPPFRVGAGGHLDRSVGSNVSAKVDRMAEEMMRGGDRNDGLISGGLPGGIH